MFVTVEYAEEETSATVTIPSAILSTPFDTAHHAE
jgi:hypothetical protein